MLALRSAVRRFNIGPVSRAGFASSARANDSGTQANKNAAVKGNNSANDTPGLSDQVEKQATAPGKRNKDMQHEEDTANDASKTRGSTPKEPADADPTPDLGQSPTKGM